MYDNLELSPKIQDRLEIQRIEDFKNVMSTPEGRRFVWRLMSAGKPFHPAFTGDSSATCFNDGMKSISLQVMRTAMDHCFELYSKARNEFVATQKNLIAEMKANGS